MHEQNWLKKHIINLCYITLNIIFSIVIASVILFFSIPAEKEYQHTQNKLHATQNKINQLTKRIAELKNTQTQTVSTYLTKKHLTDFLDYLSHFPIAGSLEISQITQDEEAKIKISGKLHRQTDFEHITQQLKQQNMPYKIDNFQRNEKNKIDFNLIITLTGNKDEKVDTP